MKTYKILVWYHKKSIDDNFGGGYTEEDVKMITKGFSFDVDLSHDIYRFYTRKNGTKMYCVIEE